MAPEARVLKIPRSDETSGYVLVNAVSRGSKPLDLKLEATEGDEEYGHALRHDKVGSLRIKNCPASEAEWQEILQNIFQLEPQPEIKVTATVQAGSSIALVVRKEIQGITQRLGEISIGIAREAGYNVLDWCATAVDFAAESKSAAKSNISKIEELERTVADLKQQLDDLIAAKVDDETSLLSKFRDLLNEKKVKIREQQKIIASSSSNDGNAASVPQSADQDGPITSVEKGRKAGKSRSGKRKAQENTVKEEAMGDDGFEPMDVEEPREDAEDTDPSDDTEATASTASDDEDDAQEAVQEESKAAKSAAASKQPNSSAKKTEQPPPARALPFARARPQPAAPAVTSGGPDSETESDDEL